MAYDVWSPFTKVSTIGSPIVAILSYLANAGANQELSSQRDAGIAQALGGLGQFGTALDAYLNKQYGPLLGFVQNIGKSNVSNAYDRAGAILRGREPNWSGRANQNDVSGLVTALRSDTGGSGGGGGRGGGGGGRRRTPTEEDRNAAIQQVRSGQFNPDWLTPADRREYDNKRFWHGPNSMFGKFKGKPEKFNEWAWQRFGNKQYIQDRIREIADQQLQTQFASSESGQEQPAYNMAAEGQGGAAPEAGAAQQGGPEDFMRSVTGGAAQQGGPEDFMRSVTEGLPEMFKGYEGQFNEIMRLLEGMGESSKRDVAKNFQKLGAMDTANLSARGLSGTTVGSAMATTRTREMSDAMAAIDEQVRQEKAAAGERISDKAISALNEILSGADTANMAIGSDIANAFLAQSGDRINNAWRWVDTTLGTHLQGLPPWQQPPAPGDYLSQAWTAGISSWAQGRAARDAAEAQAAANRAGIFGSALGAVGNIAGGALGGLLSPK